ncbi:MAG: hypothetical protein WD708_02540 [Kiritimatiellia bacterium]
MTVVEDRSLETRQRLRIKQFILQFRVLHQNHTEPTELTGHLHHQ